MFKLYLLVVVIYIHLSNGRRSYFDRNIDLVSGISPTQSVEEGSSVELECRLGNVPDRAEVAWVKMKGSGEVEYLSIYGKEEGVIDYEEEQFISWMEEEPDGSWLWSLTLVRVTRKMAGFYQCQVG